jgi:hypothetical protein
LIGAFSGTTGCIESVLTGPKPLSRQMRDHQGQNCCHQKIHPVLLEQYTQTDGKPFPLLDLSQHISKITTNLINALDHIDVKKNLNYRLNQPPILMRTALNISL